jgi:hypothetical protein
MLALYKKQQANAWLQHHPHRKHKGQAHHEEMVKRTQQLQISVHIPDPTANKYKQGSSSESV